MKTIQDQIAAKCIHFTGLGNKKCEAGISYKSVEVKGERPIKIPCIRDTILSGGECKKQQFPSEEEILKRVQEIEDFSNYSLKAYAMIKEQISLDKQNYGKIECPKCGGLLHYRRAQLNGHIWGKCESCGLGWME